MLICRWLYYTLLPGAPCVETFTDTVGPLPALLTVVMVTE